MTVARSARSLRRPLDLTPRQRQVIALIARGYTNAQIGDELGISLDGAKWHVSEIITRLGVDTREEAADYWRAYNGLRPRLLRALGRLAPSRSWRWIATGTAALVAIAAAIAFAVVALSSGDETTPAAPATATPGTSSSATATATTTSSPAPPAPATERINGIDVTPLAVGADAAVPANLHIFSTIGGYASDDFRGILQRAYLEPGGGVEKFDVFAALVRDFGVQAMSWAGDERMGEIVASACPGTGVCGAAALTQTAKAGLYRTVDGGVTWARYGDAPVGAIVIALTTDGVLYTMPPQAGARQFLLFPSGKAVTPPAEGYYPRLIHGVGLAWEPNEPKPGPTYDANGSIFYVPQFAAPQGERVISREPGGDLWVTWSGFKGKSQDQDPYRLYLAKVGPKGQPLAIWSWAPTETFVPVKVVGPDLVIGHLLLSRVTNAARLFDYESALFDLKTATIRPLRDLSAELQGNQHPFVRTTVAGEFARVTGAGDCLNVREEPTTTAKSLGCFKDGVFLPDRGETRQGGGLEWRAVTTPTGAPGWAAAQYLAK